VGALDSAVPCADGDTEVSPAEIAGDRRAREDLRLFRAWVARDLGRRYLGVTIRAGDGRVQCSHVLTSNSRSSEDRRNLSGLLTSEAVVPAWASTPALGPENQGGASPTGGVVG
jgi:hypothetical protein